MTRLYYRDRHEDDDDWGTIVILLVIVGVWWGIVHFIDWATFDIIPWWAEPFTILLLMPYLILSVKYSANPLTWWPLFWGTKVYMEDENLFSMWQKEEALNKYGGPCNVYYTQDYIKFRRRVDAVTFCLFQKTY
jgi:hypothetical protein